MDSNSDDNTVEIAETYLDRLSLRSIMMDKRGTNLGRNTGAEAAQYERILFLDADVRLKSDFLEHALTALEARKLLIDGGRIQSTGNSRLNRIGVKIFDLGMWLTQSTFPTCTGACIFSTRSVHRFIGGFDPTITLCEDCDYVKRAGQSFTFRMLPVFFEFNTRRLDQDGIFKLGYIYLKANIMRFFKGELRNNEIEYKFDHYKKT